MRSLSRKRRPVTGPGPRIVYVNPAFTARTGYTAQEVLGKTPRILQGPETDPASLEKIHHAVRAWQPIEIELINYRKDGSKHWVEISIVPVADETGFFTNWISVQRDLTERKAIYESLTLARIGRSAGHDARHRSATANATRGTTRRYGDSRRSHGFAQPAIVHPNFARGSRPRLLGEASRLFSDDAQHRSLSFDRSERQ